MAPQSGTLAPDDIVGVVDAKPQTISPDDIVGIEGDATARPASASGTRIGPAPAGQRSGAPGRTPDSAAIGVPLADKILDPVTKWMRRPGEMIAEGSAQAATGVKHLVTGQGGRLPATIDVIEGAMQAGTPWLGPALVKAPAQTILSLAAGMGTQKAVETIGRVTKRDPTVMRLVADVLGLAAGGVTAHSLQGVDTRLLEIFGRKPAATPTASASASQSAESAPVRPSAGRATPPSQGQLLDPNDVVSVAEPPGTPHMKTAAAAPPTEDVLPTGEAQPRLPGETGAVREQEVATPPVAEVPKPTSFDLTEPPKAEPAQAPLTETPAPTTPAAPTEPELVGALRAIRSARWDVELYDPETKQWTAEPIRRYGNRDTGPSEAHQRAKAPKAVQAAMSILNRASEDDVTRLIGLKELPAAEATEAPVAAKKPRAVRPAPTPVAAPKSPLEAIPEARRPHFQTVLADAKTRGYTGTDEALAERYTTALKESRRIAADINPSPEDANGDDDLLRFISAKGGLGIAKEHAGGMSGELENLMEFFGRPRGRIKKGARYGQQMPSKNSAGLPGIPNIVVRKGGMHADRLFEALNEDPRWQGKFDSLADMLEGIRDAAGRETGTYAATGKGTISADSVLDRQLNVRPGTDWWKEPITQAEHEALRAQVNTKLHAQPSLQNLPPAVLEQITNLPDYARVHEMLANLETGDMPPEDLAASYEQAATVLREIAGEHGAGPDAPAAGDIQELYGGLGGVKLPPGVRDYLQSIRDEYKSRLAVRTATPQAARSADIYRGGAAAIANQADRWRIEGAPWNKRFAKQPDAANIGAISQYERTGSFGATKELTAYTDLFKSSMEQAHRWLQEAFGKDSVGIVENYVRRMFTFDSEADAQRAMAILGGRVRRSLSANATVLRRRVLAMPLDEALTTMRNAGIKVEPVTTNPELLRQWALNNAYRAKIFKDMGDTLKGERLIRFVRPGREAVAGKLGLVPLSDRKFQVYFRGQQGLVKAGTYFAPEAVAKVLDRAISTGLSQSAIFRGLRFANNMANEINLGFSGFHAVETAVNSSVSDVALGLQQALAGGKALARGDVSGAGRAAGRAVVSVGRAATVLGSSARQLINGAAFKRALERSDPEALRVLKEKVNPAGARLALDRAYTNDAVSRFRRAIANDQYGRAILHAVPALADVISKPLMSAAIPRIKIGAFLDMVREIDQQNPSLSSAQKARAYGKAWDSIDNRMGLLTYDNLLWHRAAVDLGQIAFRSLGWNHGTELELGGGLKDLATSGLAKGELTSRSAFALALPIYVGMLGAVYQYLHTGHWPTELKDYFYPRNGTLDPSGNEDRAALKTYMSDAVNFVHDPLTTVLHKRSPLLEWGWSMLANENYFGDLIRNPNDPKAKQLEQAGKFALQTIAPFSISQFKQERDQGTPVEQSVERGASVQKAPRWLVQTQTQQRASQAVQQRLGTRHRTPEQVETDTLRTTARKELARSANGPTPAFDRLLQSGAMPSLSSVQQFIADAGYTPYQRTLLSLTLRERGNVDAGTLKRLMAQGLLKTPAQIDRFLALVGSPVAAK